jgi:hypothetical protein
LHINSTRALCPREYLHDDGGIYYPSDTQRWILRSWLDYWRRVWTLKRELGAVVYGVVNGDAVDKNRHSGYQLISVNEQVIIDNALTVMIPFIQTCDYRFIVRGTEAHTGGVGWMEERIAKEIGAERDTAGGTASWLWLPLELHGYRFGFAHHPVSNSMRPWTQGNAANRSAATLVYEFFGESAWPEIVVFGHVHHDEDSYDNHPIRAIYLPPWSVGNFFDARCGRAFQRPTVEGNIFVITPDDVDLTKVRYRPRRRPFWKAEEHQRPWVEVATDGK